MLRRHKITSKDDNVWHFERKSGDVSAQLYLYATQMDWYSPYEGPQTIDKMFDQLVIDLAYQLEDWKVANIPGYVFNQAVVEENATRHPSRRNR